MERSLPGGTPFREKGRAAAVIRKRGLLSAADYTMTFAEARERALGSAESLALIRRIAKEMT